MKLSQWAKEQGLTYKGAWRMWKAGQLPVPARAASHRHHPRQGKQGPGSCGRTLRPSFFVGAKKRFGRLVVYAHQHKVTIVEAVSEVGSGLNGHRPKLLQLLAHPQIQTILVEHRDRLMRFGAEYVEAALAAQGRKLMVMDSSEVKDDLVQDRIEVLTSFCARLYGRRSARNKAKKAVQAMEP
jgi:putative resolvase